MAQALAAFVGLVVQYRIWRRLKDNKTLQELALVCISFDFRLTFVAAGPQDELGRYEKKLQQHMRQLMQFDAAPQEKLGGDDGQLVSTHHTSESS